MVKKKKLLDMGHMRGDKYIEGYHGGLFITTKNYLEMRFQK